MIWPSVNMSLTIGESNNFHPSVVFSAIDHFRKLCNFPEMDCIYPSAVVCPKYWSAHLKIEMARQHKYSVRALFQKKRTVGVIRSARLFRGILNRKVKVPQSSEGKILHTLLHHAEFFITQTNYRKQIEILKGKTISWNCVNCERACHSLSVLFIALIQWRLSGDWPLSSWNLSHNLECVVLQLFCQS